MELTVHCGPKYDEKQKGNFRWSIKDEEVEFTAPTAARATPQSVYYEPCCNYTGTVLAHYLLGNTAIEAEHSRTTF